MGVGDEEVSVDGDDGVVGDVCGEAEVHEEAAAKARAAGMKVVMDRCILNEHRRLML